MQKREGTSGEGPRGKKALGLDIAGSFRGTECSVAES